MLKKLYRFHGHNSLNFAHSKGASVRASYLQLKFIQNNRQKHSRLAVIVSKKVAKRAPARNRIRRRVYEHTRQHWDMIQEPYDLIITVFDERIGEISSSELNRLLVELLHKANLYKN